MKIVPYYYDVLLKFDRLTEHNELASKMLQAWNKNRPGEALTADDFGHLWNDYRKMLFWEKQIIRWGEGLKGFSVFCLVLIPTLVLYLEYLSLTQHKPINGFVSFVCGSLVVYSVFILLSEHAERVVKSYGDVGSKLNRLTTWIEKVCLLYPGATEVDSIINKIKWSALCVIKIEKGVGYQTMTYEQSQQLYEAKNFVKNAVSLLEEGGIIDGDLKPYFDWAEAEWQKMANKGQVMTDFQI